MKRIMGLVMGFMLMCGSVFAADGDLIVTGKIGVGTLVPERPIHVHKAGTGSLSAISLWSTENNTTGETHRSAFYGQDSGAGIIRSLVACAGPLNAGTANQGRMDFITENGNMFMASISSLESSGGTTLYLYDRVGSGAVKVKLNSNGNSFLSGGNVGIGVTNPGYQLQLSADSTWKPGGGLWGGTSDVRLKTDIQPYSKGLKEILQINPVSYKYNGKGGIGHNKITSIDPVTGKEVETEVVDTKLLETTFVGIIAQDIQTVVPETVTSHKGMIDKNDAIEADILDFNGSALTFVMINAIKDLKTQIDSLNKQIDDLKARVK